MERNYLGDWVEVTRKDMVASDNTSNAERRRGRRNS